VGAVIIAVLAIGVVLVLVVTLHGRTKHRVANDSAPITMVDPRELLRRVSHA
jgi:hypothetical protein